MSLLFDGDGTNLLTGEKDQESMDAANAEASAAQAMQSAGNGIKSLGTKLGDGLSSVASGAGKTASKGLSL